jgi:transcriptional antiterminator NusG
MKMSEAVEVVATESPAVENPNWRWYVVHVFSGFENRISQIIREKAAKQGIAPQFGQIMIPTEDVIEIKRGQRKQVERKYMPGYVLVQMEMTDDAWHLVKSIDRVTGFLGADKKKPMPITGKEAQRLISQGKSGGADGEKKPRNLITYDIGDSVRVTDGPFNSFTGTVEEVDEDRQRLKVSVSIFGRATPVELEYSQVEKGK